MATQPFLEQFTGEMTKSVAQSQPVEVITASSHLNDDWKDIC